MAISIQANLANVQEWDATRGPLTDVEPGLYEVKTTDVVEHKATVKYSVTGPFGTCEVFIPKDMTKDSNARKMKAAILSHGAKREKIEAAGDKLTITESLFVGRTAFMLVTAVEGVDDKGRKLLNDKAFVTPEQAAAWKKANASKPAAPKADPAPAANGAAPAGAPAGESGLGDLFG